MKPASAKGAKQAAMATSQRQRTKLAVGVVDFERRRTKIAIGVVDFVPSNGLNA